MATGTVRSTPAVSVAAARLDDDEEADGEAGDDRVEGDPAEEDPVGEDVADEVALEDPAGTDEEEASAEVPDPDNRGTPTRGNRKNAARPINRASTPKTMTGARLRPTGPSWLRWTPWRAEFSGTLSNSSRG
jgi:hypothetical protein